MQEMISILKESGFGKDICDVIQVGPHELNIVLYDNTDISAIMKIVNEIDSQFWRTREPIKMTYIYQDGRGAII